MHNYSKLDRLLHHLALGIPFLSELCFDLEKNIFKPIARPQNSIYVTGLARAGTTALMHSLYASDQFASLTYDDMPFVLAPNLWSKVSSLHSKQRVMQERVHGDGIQVDFDAPEAFEEVFWRLYCGASYISPSVLHPHSVDAETVSQLLYYQSLVCMRYGRPRYLAKNNNHILRLASLANQTREITYLVVFRDPIAQATSLLKQHQRFRDADSFTKQYMTWLAHYEFGATHRPFQLSEYTTVVGSTDCFEYWLQRWIDAYAYLLRLLKQNFSNLIPVSYEKFCGQPDYWFELCRKIGLPETPSTFREVQNNPSPVVSDAQLQCAQAIYHELNKLACDRCG